MKFFAFLKRLPAAEHDDVMREWQKCRGLLAGSVQRQFVINLEDDLHLCEAACETIKDVILRSSSDKVILQRELTGACRIHTLQGSVVSTLLPSSLGRAVTKDLFAELLREQFSFNTKHEEDQFMDDLLRHGVTIISTRRQLDGKLLARRGRVMWATFDPDSLSGPRVGGESPFAKMPPDADGIRAQLGLSKNDEGKDLLLFVYTLPGGIEPRFPTIAEAYAGDDWPYYFRPARELEAWGSTMPWDASPPLPSSPEVVHAPVTGDNLVETIGVAKGF